MVKYFVHLIFCCHTIDENALMANFPQTMVHIYNTINYNEPFFPRDLAKSLILGCFLPEGLSLSFFRLLCCSVVIFGLETMSSTFCPIISLQAIKW